MRRGCPSAGPRPSGARRPGPARGPAPGWPQRRSDQRPDRRRQESPRSGRCRRSWPGRRSATPGWCRAAPPRGPRRATQARRGEEHRSGQQSDRGQREVELARQIRGSRADIARVPGRAQAEKGDDSDGPSRGAYTVGAATGREPASGSDRSRRRAHEAVSSSLRGVTAGVRRERHSARSAASGPSARNPRTRHGPIALPSKLAGWPSRP